MGKINKEQALKVLRKARMILLLKQIGGAGNELGDAAATGMISDALKLACETIESPLDALVDDLIDMCLGSEIFISNVAQNDERVMRALHGALYNTLCKCIDSCDIAGALRGELDRRGVHYDGAE